MADDLTSAIEHSSSSYAIEFLEEAQKSVDFTFSSICVLPGDEVTSYVTRVVKKLRIGMGLEEIGEKVYATMGGMLKYHPPNRFWVEHNYKRYIPSIGDDVIGIIEDRTGEFYKVNIGGPSPAILSLTAFDGASKRNRPNLLVGSLVYTRVVSLPRGMDIELSCEATSRSTRKDWMTGESIYGELHKGLVVACSNSLVKNLLQEECPLLVQLGKSTPYEIAIGMNGFFWVNSPSNKYTVGICNSILATEP